MKKLILTIMTAVLLTGSALFAAQNSPDRVATISNLKTNVTVGAVANLFTGAYRDTLTKEAATATEMDTTVLVDKIYVDPLKYTGFELRWRVTAVSTDSLWAGASSRDTIFPMLWNSHDGTNWNVITGSTGITQDTITGTTAAIAAAVIPMYKAYYKVDGALADRGRYWRIGARYSGHNEDAITAATINYSLEMVMFKE